ncbi:NAD kinase-like isoform X2 [Anopheles cruzii]|uniref:NAD kinase-like isoform X2 n=1 Tax=Anopheles cruzii TaxID=68878 RepID=UPI0022EC89F2|nr:NAD kinase-like isoform X2 [Anopheles cruzii]
MAYLSDVDLATLHKSRLEERVQYRLSSLWTRDMEPSRELPAKARASQVAVAPPATNTRAVGVSAAIASEQQHHRRSCDRVNNNHIVLATETASSMQEHILQRSFTPTAATMRGRTPGCSKMLHHQQHQHQQQQQQQPTISFDGHVIRPRIRSSNSMSSGGTSTSSSSSSGGGRRRRSGTWPRTRSLNAPSPFQQFGPCGRIMKNSAMVMQIQDPASQRLTWYKPPLAVLVIKKVRDSKVLQPFVELVEWLIHEKHMVVWVEAAILDDALLTGDKRFTKLQDKLITFKDGRDDLTDKIDFIICLGGDGTLLYASLLFQKSVPPVMAFHLGSLGFLTPFQFDNFQEQVTNVLEGHAALTLRSRLRCIIVRKDKTEQEISTFKSSQDPSTNILVLNEVVIDRGLSSYLSNIDLFLDGKHITSVQGDGLIVSTPTGSTAYSAAAGASMIHPSVPAILVTPICPHSLSFRPIVLPAGVELKIAISPDSRNSSWVSFDGRNRQELLHGDSLHVTTSIYPVPSICAQDQIADWFDSLAECLHWNVRKRQKCLDELSDLTGSGAEDGGAIDEIVRGMEKLEN